MRPFLSNDQRRIAIGGRGGVIAIHDLAAGRWNQIKTDGTRFVFVWSPDDRYLGYADLAGALRVLDVQSGVTRTIATLAATTDGFGFAWCTADEILVSLGWTTGLFKVAAKGGDLREFLGPATGAGETGLVRPQCLPGNRFAAGVSKGRPGTTTRLGDAGASNGGETRDLPGFWLLLDDTRGLTVSSDSILFQRLEPGRGPVGDPTLMARDVALSNATALASVGPETLVYRGTEPMGQRELAWFNRSGARLGAVEVPDGARNPQLSRDGAWLAYEVFQGDSQFRDVHVLHLADGQRHRIAQPGLDTSDPQWSSDTSKVIVGHGETRALVVHELATGANSDIQPDADPTMFRWPSAWSADGGQLMFTTSVTSCGTLDVRRKQIGPTVYPHAINCQFSPDGRFVSYVDTAANGMVVVEPFPPTGARWEVSQEGGNAEPRWHPNGRELFFLDADKTLMASAVTVSPQFKAAAPVPLFRARIPVPTRIGVAFNYSIAPDGRFLINTIKPGTEPAALSVILNWQPPDTVRAGSR